jgi:hypothetical protein
MSFNLLRNFCRVLQISPKHFKISQYKSCLVFRGTQLCFWVAFQILSGKGQKTWSTATFTIHRRHENRQLCLQFMLKPLRKHRLAFIKVVEGPLIYNFAICPLVHFSSSFWRNWQSNKASWNILGDVASRATPRGALSVSASGSSLTPCAPRTHTDQAPGSPRWTPAAPHAGQPRVSPRRPDPPFLPPWRRSKTPACLL